MSKRKIATIIIMIVLVAAGWMAWVWFALGDDAGSNGQATTEQMVQEIDRRVSAEVTGVELNDQLEDEDYAPVVHYQPSGYEYFATADSDITTNYVPDDSTDNEIDPNLEAWEIDEEKVKQIIQPVEDIILETLQQNDYTEISDYPVEDLIGAGSVYENTDNVCAVISGYAAGISCTSKANLMAVAEEVKPFVKILETSSRELDLTDPGYSFSVIGSGSGKTEQDMYLILGAGVGGEYFYQDDGEWKYYTGSSDGISCPDPAENQQAADAFVNICLKPGEGL